MTFRFNLPTFLLVAFAGTQAFADSPLVGSWYTEGVENGVRAQFVIRNHQDGSFTKDIRDGTNCSAILHWRETGTWSFDGKVYKETTKAVRDEKVDAKDPLLNDVFEITVVDDTHLLMTDQKTHIAWSLRSVPANFAMPAPTGCTI